MREALEAIAEAHSLGIVHRDMKPANLFLATSPSGHVSVKVSR
jgi:serine/threonine-protein kinase